MNLQALRDSVNRKDYQVCEPLTPDEMEALKASVAANGVTVPVAVDEEFRIIDGYHRMEVFFALVDAGVDVPVPQFEVLAGLTEQAKWDEAYRRNYQRRQMTPAQKAAKAVDLCRKGLSNEQIAATIGVSCDSAERYTAEERKEQKRQRDQRIRQLAQEGKSIREIANELGVSKSAVDRVIGVPKSANADSGTPDENDSAAETTSTKDDPAVPAETDEGDLEDATQTQDPEDASDGKPDEDDDAPSSVWALDPVSWEDVKQKHGHKYEGKFNEEAHTWFAWERCYDCVHCTDARGDDDLLHSTCEKLGVYLEDWQQYSDYPPCYSLETDMLEHLDRQAEDEQPESSSQSVHFSSESPEHYTPAHVLDAVVNLLGGIDLDPCSNSKTDPNVNASVHYTQVDNGLQQKWVGRTYMNPPYGRGIQDWVRKLVDSFESGDVTEAIALVPARTDTQWWQLLRNYPCCFVTGRLTFIGNNDPAPFPSAIYYLGERHDDFYREFSSFGDIWIRLDEHWFTE